MREYKYLQRHWKDIIWNSESKEFFGRTASGWGKLLLFYTCFYSFLAALFLLMLFVLYTTISDEVPTYLLDKAILSTPGLAVYPLGVIVDHRFHHLNYIPETITNDSSLLKPMLALMSKYRMGSPHQSFVNCENNVMPKERQLCYFDLDSLGPYCSEENYFGYSSASPCLILKLNRVYGWLPEVYNQNETGDWPNELKALADDFEIKTGLYPKMIWIFCSTDNPKITMDYYPYPGYPMGFYPFTNQKGYMSPLVAVHMKDVPRDKPVVVKCGVYVKNIQGEYMSTHGTIKFTLEIGTKRR